MFTEHAPTQAKKPVTEKKKTKQIKVVTKLLSA